MFGRRYSAIELRDIAVSVLVLSVAFTIALRRWNELGLLSLFALSAMIVCTSFVMHELAHKYVAQRYGAWAEYRMFPTGLIIALVLSMSGFLFAAPGAVYISGHINREMNGRISAAGPAVNIIIGGAAAMFAYVTTGMLSSVLWIMAMINAFFAVFNLIPIKPFDGSKICRWNIPVYGAMMAAAVCLLLTAWFR